MKRYAVIDIGSNSIRLLKCEVENGQMRSAEKELIMTRLGKGVNEQKCLSDESMESSYKALEHFVQSAQGYGAPILGAFATSAVRDSSNREFFVAEVQRRTGLKVTVIDGDQEARLGYLGVMSGLTRPFETLMVIDIGGGSTEIIIGDKSGILFAKSFDMGAVRMTEMFLPSDPPTMEQLRALSEYVQTLASEITTICKTYQPQVAVGIGGTITTVGAVALKMDTYNRDQIHNYELQHQEIELIFDSFISKNLEDRKALPGLQPKRADIIVAGTAILRAVLNQAGLKAISISDYDNLEGILAERSILKI